MPLPMPMPKNMGAPKVPPVGAGDPGEAATGPGAGGPTPSPMATPAPMPGMEKGARIKIQMASHMLQQELPNFPLDSEQFKAISRALEVIGKAFGKSADEDRKMFPAETMDLLHSVGPGSMSPGAKAIAGMPPGGAGAPPPGAGAPPQLPA